MKSMPLLLIGLAVAGLALYEEKNKLGAVGETTRMRYRGANWGDSFFSGNFIHRTPWDNTNLWGMNGLYDSNQLFNTWYGPR